MTTIARLSSSLPRISGRSRSHEEEEGKRNEALEVPLLGLFLLMGIAACLHWMLSMFDVFAAFFRGDAIDDVVYF